MSNGRHIAGLDYTGRSLHRTERGTPVQSRLTEFLLDVAVAVGAIVAALIASVCLIVPPAYYLFF